MTRTLRAFSRPRQVTVETSQKCIQSRYLLRADPVLNRRVIGHLARAQARYGVQIHGFVTLSNHWHLLATYSDSEQMAKFHCHFTTNLSKEIATARRWRGPVFPERYRHVELSQEPEIELARLRYLLGQGCKEGLVASPLDWPGASSTAALLSGEPMIGEWLDRKAFHAARRSDRSIRSDDFIHQLKVELSPIPSLADISVEEYRKTLLELVRDIETETALMHRSNGTKPIGTAVVLARDPLHRPEVIEETPPRPWFHARSKTTRRAMRTALVYIFAAYRDAACRLKAGNRQAVFPPYTFPPNLPYARPIESLAPD